MSKQHKPQGSLQGGPSSIPAATQEQALVLFQEDLSLRQKELAQRAIEAQNNVELGKLSIQAQQKDRADNRTFVLQMANRVGVIMFLIVLLTVGSFLWLCFGGHKDIAILIGKGVLLITTHLLTGYFSLKYGQNKQKAADAQNQANP